MGWAPGRAFEISRDLLLRSASCLSCEGRGAWGAGESGISRRPSGIVGLAAFQRQATGRPGVVDDAVADVGDRFDRRWFAEFAAQPADSDVHGIGEGVGVLVPHLGEQLLGAQHLIAGAEKRLEDGELLAGEAERPAMTGGGVVQRVKLDPGGAEHARLGDGSPTGEAAHAEHELGEVKRFGQLVVGAESQAAGALVRISLLAAIGARTSRIEIGLALQCPKDRNPIFFMRS